MRSVAGLALGLMAAGALAADPAPKKILFFSKSAGFEHAVIKETGGKPSYVEGVLRGLEEKHALRFTFTKDGRVFTPEYLAQFDAFFFYTSGDLTQVGTDGHPAMTVAGKEALLQAVAAGKGFIGTHAATDTFLSPGNEGLNAPARNQPDGDRTDPYLRMLGGEFINHNAQQRTHLIVADPAFPGLAAVPVDFGPYEEWYSLKDFPADLHVLLVQDTRRMQGPVYQRPPYPETWVRRQGRGRVFYTSMGHREDIWVNPVFQAVLLGGIDWALGRVDADITPNLSRAAPQANVLPAYVPRPPAGAR
jgi:type 1 glutamine amidotransferase